MNLDLSLEKIWVMQDELRHTSQVPFMIDFVKKGGFYTVENLKKYALDHIQDRVCPLMEIVFFPDGHCMVHDGHHRVTSIQLGGRNYIRGDEYVSKFWDYSNYLKINFNNRWVTPFDPRTHIRVPDIATFKQTALNLFAVDQESAEVFITENSHLYLKERTFWNVKELAEQYLKTKEYCVN